MTTRQITILELLADRQRVDVAALSEMLHVSQVSIRKDLDHLQARGFINRAHGYACIDSRNDTGKRMAHNYKIKKNIAQAAAATVEEGETVMIESGSCCAFLAEELARTKKDITILTNSVFIANFIGSISPMKIILLGGFYLPNSQVIVGPMTKKCSEIFFSDKFFVGTDGFMPGFGFTGKDHLRVQTVADLAEKARDVVVLTGAEKFQRQGSLGLLRLDRVRGVFTDERIPAEAEAELLKHKVALHKVPSHEA